MSTHADKAQRNKNEIVPVSAPDRKNSNLQAKQLRAVPAVQNLLTEPTESFSAEPLTQYKKSSEQTTNASVIQRITSGLKTFLLRSGYEEADATKVGKWQELMRFSDKNIETLFQEGHLDDAIVKWPAVPRPKLTAAEMITNLSEPAPVLVPIVDLLREQGIETVYARQIETNETADKIRTFVGTINDGNREAKVRILMCVGAKQNKIAEVTKLLAIAKYTIAEKLELARKHGAPAVISAINATRPHETNTSYIENWISLNVAGINTLQYKQLVRFKSLLATGAQLTIQKADVLYAAKGGGHRTGFLQYAFNTETMYIHTHWDNTDPGNIIYSMHVQDPASAENGPEITFWDCFADVKAEVIRAQNL